LRQAHRIARPTGCGDAYRAGLLHGIQQGWDWETTGRLASLLGTLKIASRGGQNHTPSIDRVEGAIPAAFRFRRAAVNPSQSIATP